MMLILTGESAPSVPLTSRVLVSDMSCTTLAIVCPPVVASVLYAIDTGISTTLFQSALLRFWLR